MLAIAWIVFALGWRIILAQDTDCDLAVDDSCFFARINLSSWLNYNEAVEYCKSKGGDIAPIKNEEILSQLMDKLRNKTEEEINYFRFWIATKIDSDRNLSPEGSYAKWYPSFPFTSHGKFRNVNVYLLIHKDANFKYQGMVNINPSRKLEGVICEKFQEAGGLCDSFSTTGLTYWLQLSDLDVNQHEAEAQCQAKGGTLAIPLSDEHYKCFPRLLKDEAILWFGYKKGPGETKFKTMDGSEPSYIQSWLNEDDVRLGSGENGVVAYMDPSSSFLSADSSDYKVYGGFCQKQKPNT